MKKTEKQVERAHLQYAAIAAIVAIVAVLGVVYWSSIRVLIRHWDKPDYSHGYLVPVFACVLLWVRREKYPSGALRGSVWGGVLILAQRTNVPGCRAFWAST